MDSTDLLHLSPVVPVAVLHDVDHAVPLAKALLRGGIRTVEVTLRTTVGLASIERIATEVPEIVVGAGTITEAHQAKTAADAGARYLVTPGCTDRLLDAVDDTELPSLPGVSTVSEALRVAERGARALKFFPAEASGGIPYLKALAGPLPELRFCPTGGISQTTAADYLAVPNVGCVGGSWLTDPKLLSTGDWDRIEVLAREAAALR